jgi:hypothetical protein
MANTMQDVCDRARVSLHDDDKTRYADADLINYGNAAVAHILTVRPDLAFGSYTAAAHGDYALTDTFPLPYRFMRVVSDYVVSRAESVDDQYASDGRSAQFGQLFDTEVKSL